MTREIVKSNEVLKSTKVNKFFEGNIGLAP